MTVYDPPEEYCYDEEILLSYEAGFKSTLMDGRARVNGSFYYYNYSDYQVFQFIGTSGAVYNSDAEYYGGEVGPPGNPGSDQRRPLIFLHKNLFMPPI